MNWSIHSYSAGKLTIRMIHVHFVIQCHSWANTQELVRISVLTECITDQFIEALTDLDNATGKDVWCQNQKKMKRHDDARQKSKKNF